MKNLENDRIICPCSQAKIHTHRIVFISGFVVDCALILLILVGRCENLLLFRKGTFFSIKDHVDPPMYQHA